MYDKEPPVEELRERGGTTGRYLMVFDEGVTPAAVARISKSAGMKVAHSADYGNDTKLDVQTVLASEADGVFFDELNVAVCDVPRDQSAYFATAAVVYTEPERYVFVPQTVVSQALPPAVAPVRESLDYYRGFHDGVRSLKGEAANPPANAPALVAPGSVTWGLTATGVLLSKFTGKGVRVAVLDTGFFFAHGDFAGRTFSSASFVRGESADDGNGHGTHCAGTLCGPKQPKSGVGRYGIASDVDLFVAKVLSNRGVGTDGSILAGIDWALRNACRIISMSLGAPTAPDEKPSSIFEEVARRALARNTLIIAAAGNDSDRPNRLRTVSRPANCPSIMAVGAVDVLNRVAKFSNGGSVVSGGEVNIVGPGVDVESSITGGAHKKLDGTSMATPHVAGIAALYLEEEPTLTARELWQKLESSAAKINGASRVDVGAGLVQSV